MTPHKLGYNSHFNPQKTMGVLYIHVTIHFNLEPYFQVGGWQG